MDEFDLFARDGPPPRHQLESDSEDSEEEQPQFSRPAALPATEFKWENGTPSTFVSKNVIVLESPAGESYLATFDLSSPKPEVVGDNATLIGGVGHVPQAQVVLVQDTVYVFLRPSPSVTTLPEAANALATKLIDTLQPRRYVLPPLWKVWVDGLPVN